MKDVPVSVCSMQMVNKKICWAKIEKVKIYCLTKARSSVGQLKISLQCSLLRARITRSGMRVKIKMKEAIRSL